MASNFCSEAKQAAGGSVVVAAEAVRCIFPEKRSCELVQRAGIGSVLAVIRHIIPLAREQADALVLCDTTGIARGARSRFGADRLRGFLAPLPSSCDISPTPVWFPRRRNNGEYRIHYRDSMIGWPRSRIAVPRNDGMLWIVQLLRNT